MKKIYSLLAVAVLLLVSNHALAGGGGSSSTFYFKVMATSTNAAEGLVYAASAATDEKTYVESDTVAFSKSASGNSTNNTFHYYAQPTAGHKFVGWTANPLADSVVYVSVQKHYSRSLTSNSTSEAAPATAQYFAVFAEATELYSSRMIAQAVGAEGTVSVSTVSGSTEYAAQMEDSLIGISDTMHTYYLRAAAPEGVETRFVAWYSDDSLQHRLSTNANYTYNVLANDTAALFVYNVYALFEEIPFLLSNVTATAEGPGQVAVLTASNQTPEYSTQTLAQQRVADRTTHTYYLRAKGNDADFVEFLGWFVGDSLISGNTSYTYTVASAAADTAYAVVAHFAERNPYQFRNGSFEDWSNNEPIGWHGPRTAIGSMAGLASGSAPAPVKVSDAHSGESAVRLASKSVLGVAANGNLTTGVMNMGSMTATASSNNNHTVIDDPNFHLVILGQPDSVVYYAKFSRGDTSRVYTGSATIYMHDSVQNFQDPALESQVPHLMAKAIALAPESNEWTRCSGAFDYDTYAWSFDSVQMSTKFILCDLATNPEAGATSGDTLIVDDIQFVYNSHLDSAFYAGQLLEFADGAAVVDAEYVDTLLACYKGGRGTIVEPVYNPNTGILTITVKGQDYEYNAENQHVYTVQFNRQKFLVTFAHENGDVLQADSVAYGEMPEFAGATPAKEATAQYTYNFAGWSPAVAAVIDEVIYVAQFDSVVNKYVITFAHENGDVLQADSVAYGEMPVYLGETPAKAEDTEYTYTFKGWTPELEIVVAAATYTATFEAEEKPKTALENVQLENGVKVMEDGVVYILRNGQRYTVTGQVIK